MEAEARQCHKRFKECGMKSLHVLDSNISNPRYPGFSEFTSSNALRNSSYCWTIGKDHRIKDKSYKKYNDNIYNIPRLLSQRYTILGYGQRGSILDFGKKYGPSPDTYKICSVFDYNIKHKKGITLGMKLNYSSRENRYKPGPGAYTLRNLKKFGILPITIKSRIGFFYDDELKKKKATVSMQKYKPKYTLVQMNRYKDIGFGFGNRPYLHATNRYPGPGTYNIPGNFDRGYKGKLPLN